MELICLGDSLTYGFGVNRDERWLQLVSQQTTDKWRNAGINGDTTGGMLCRLPALLSQRPDAVLITGGNNDFAVGAPIGVAKANVMAMVHQAISQGVIPWVGTPSPIYPSQENPWGPATQQAQASVVMEEFVQWLRVFAKTFGVQLVDIHRALVEGGGQSLYLADGLHLTPRGHQVIAQYILNDYDKRKGRLR